MSRRLLPPQAMANRRPWLLGSLLLVAFAIGLFLAGNDWLAMTAMIGAFLAVAVAKRAG
jgi:hypothetical protein